VAGCGRAAPGLAPRTAILSQLGYRSNQETGKTGPKSRADKRLRLPSPDPAAGGRGFTPGPDFKKEKSRNRISSDSLCLQGLPEFQALPWWSLFAPKGVPQPILDALTDALDKALDDEQVRKRFSDLGGDIPGKERRGQQPLAALVKSEIARWTPIIKAANVTIG
jgi:hypothetical protein